MHPMRDEGGVMVVIFPRFNGHQILTRDKVPSTKRQKFVSKLFYRK
jgi:hypothetical protein